MSSSDSSSSMDFYLRLNEQRESAAEQLDQRFRRQLCALVEREMNSRLLTREDPEDAVQSAFASFYRGIREERFHIDHGGGLWRLLEQITRRKVLKHAERAAAVKRSPKAEVHVEGDAFVSSEPAPEDAVIVADLMERAIAGLLDPDPDIFRLTLGGWTQDEIATRFGITRANVRSTLDRIRDRIRRLLTEKPDR